jgi:hypothetical protein
MIAGETTIRGILSGKLKSEMPKETDIRKLMEEMGLQFTDNTIKEIYHSIVVCAFGLGISRRDSQIKADLKILEKHADVLLKHADELDEYLKVAVVRTGELVIRQDELYDLDESGINPQSVFCICHKKPGPHRSFSQLVTQLSLNLSVLPVSHILCRWFQYQIDTPVFHLF